MNSWKPRCRVWKDAPAEAHTQPPAYLEAQCAVAPAGCWNRPGRRLEAKAPGSHPAAAEPTRAPAPPSRTRGRPSVGPGGPPGVRPPPWRPLRALLHRTPHGTMATIQLISVVATRMPACSLCICACAYQ